MTAHFLRFLCSILLSVALISCSTDSKYLDTSRAEGLPLNQAVLKTIAQMPKKGGYSTRNEAFTHLQQAVTWNHQQQKIALHVDKATPSFCSEAVYLAFLQLLINESDAGRLNITPSAWASLLIAEKQPDGHGIWGRANANGPGWASLIHELGAGYSFTEMEKARPGDVLKIFWNNEIGAHERGHLVIFLGIEPTNDGDPLVWFWSSNIPHGYGIKSTPQSTIKRSLFTRFTHLAAVNKADKLPYIDAGLASLLKKRASQQEYNQKAGLTSPEL